MADVHSAKTGASEICEPILDPKIPTFRSFETERLELEGDMWKGGFGK
jgi:hypothetical protein